MYYNAVIILLAVTLTALARSWVDHLSGPYEKGLPDVSSNHCEN